MKKRTAINEALLGTVRVVVIVDLQEFKDMELRGEALEYANSILTDRIKKMVRVLGNTECEIEPVPPTSMKVTFTTHISITEKDVKETFTRYYIPIKRITITQL